MQLKQISTLVLCASCASAAFADLTLDFNTPGQFHAYFSSAQSGPIYQSVVGGLDDTGSLNLSAMTGGETHQQILTFNQSFSSTLASWSTSLYYSGNAQNFWQFGVTTIAAPDLDSGYPASGGVYPPLLWVAGGNADGGTLGIASYDGSAEDWEARVVPGGIPTAAQWYQVVMSVNYLGSATYNVSMTMNHVDEDGVFVSTLGTLNHEVVNQALTDAGQLYIFINMYDGVAIDNFYTSTYVVPEPTTSAALVAAGLASLVLLRGHLRRRSVARG